MTSVLLAVLVAATPSSPPAGSAPAPEVEPAPSAAGPAQVPGSPPGVATPRAETIVLGGVADVRRMCEAAALPESREPAGELVERADAEARRAEERGAALDSQFRAVFPGARLRFSRWAPGESLGLQRHAPLVTADEGLRLDPLGEPSLPVRADAATVKRVLAAQKERTLELRVTFLLEDEEAPCFHVPGARTWTVSAEPVAWEYVSGDEVLARGGEDADRPTVSAKAGAKPRVRLGDGTEGESTSELRGAVLEHVGKIEGCYTSALDRDPWVDGAIVADLEARGRGRPEKVRIAADTTNDAQLVACVRDVLASLDLRGAGGRAFLPIHFVLER